MIKQSNVDIEFVRNPKNWPLFPILPVKRPSLNGTGWPELGFMVANGESTVFIGDIHELHFGPLGPQLEEMDIRRYDSLECLFSDGWMVD